jgi:hypothetical protein
VCYKGDEIDHGARFDEQLQFDEISCVYSRPSLDSSSLAFSLSLLCYHSIHKPSMDVKWPGLGAFSLLGERILLRILRKVAVRELLLLMRVSKSFYCFANYNKICE